MRISARRTVLAAAFVGSACLLSAAFAQQQGGGKPGTPARPLSVALIDLKQVFSGYRKAKDLEAEVTAATQDAQAKIQELGEKLAKAQEQLKPGTLEEGSPQWRAAERKVIQMTSQLKGLQEQTKRDLVRQQAAAALAAFSDVQNALAQFAEFNGYTLILQNSNELQESSDPRQLDRQLAQNIIYSREMEDITAPVVSWLNQKYDEERGNKKAPATRAATATPKPGAAAPKPASQPAPTAAAPRTNKR